MITFHAVRLLVVAECVECGRVFDLTDDTEADEYYNGHDCEDETP